MVGIAMQFFCIVARVLVEMPTLRI